MTHPVPTYPNKPSLAETIWANADADTGDWETYATAATSNTYVAVNSAGTSDWVWLHNHRVIFAESEGSRTLRYDMQSPSGDVNPYQTVSLIVRARRYDSASADPPSSCTITISLYENGSQVTGGGGTAQNVNNTNATEYEQVLSVAAISAVSDWDDVEVHASFAASGIDTSPPEHYVTFRVYEVKIQFST